MKKLIDKLFLFMGYVPYGKLINDNIIIECHKFEVDKLINQKKIPRGSALDLNPMDSNSYANYIRESMEYEMLSQLKPYFIYTIEEDADGGGWIHKLLLYIGRRK